MGQLIEGANYTTDEPFETRLEYIHSKLKIPLEQIERLRNTNKCKNILFEDYFLATYSRLKNYITIKEQSTPDSTTENISDFLDFDEDIDILDNANRIILGLNKEITASNYKNTNRRLAMDIITPLVTFFGLVMFLIPSTPFLLKSIFLISSISTSSLYFYFRFIYKIFKDKELIEFIDYKN